MTMMIVKSQGADRTNKECVRILYVTTFAVVQVPSVRHGDWKEGDVDWEGHNNNNNNICGANVCVCVCVCIRCVNILLQ